MRHKHGFFPRRTFWKPRRRPSSGLIMMSQSHSLSSKKASGCQIQLETDTSAYRHSSAHRLSGELDVGALKRAFHEVVWRHEILRTAFVSRNGRLEQVVAPMVPWKLPVVDLEGLPSAVREERMRRLVREESEKAFDLGRSPLMRSISDSDATGRACVGSDAASCRYRQLVTNGFIPRARSVVRGVLAWGNVAARRASSSVRGLCGVAAEMAPGGSPGVLVSEQSERLVAEARYRKCLFEASTIQRMLSQWQSLLERVVVSPDEPIASFALASAETSSSLPDPSVHLPELPMEPVPRVFESWAERRPEQTALRQGNRRYSYGELHQGATTLARRLVAGRSSRGEVVAVTGPRSFGFIESALGVLLSGGVLVTLDRRLPAERQRLMLREAAAARIVYVGEPRPEDQWIWELSLPVTEVPRNGGAADDKSVPQADLPALQGDDEAYVFFTSGTTGVPKGVLGCHKGLSHFLKWQREAFGVGPDDRCSHLTSVSFDVVLREIFLPLTSGGTLCLVDDEADVAASAILAWLAEEEIAIVHTVPTLAQAWLSADTSDDDIRSVRCVFFAGEPLQGRLANRWRAKFPGTKQVVNLYGPTETTLAKCFYVVPDHVIDGIQPLGKPLPQSQALVWGRAHQACAIGEPGEIVIRTPYRTLGYINAPEENDLHFVKNPYRDDEKDVVYFTGDRGRYRADGNIEILGRLDEQVKIRGARVELGEVASALVSLPTVLDSAVVARDQDDERRLIAYVVLEAGEASVARTLRDYLKQKLPEYMVPSAFVVMDSLPLTPSGKVDRKALPAPESARGEFSERLRLPRTAHEETLARVWKEVLSEDEVGIDDNFFELGGHSLLATQVMSRVRQTFEVELPLRNLFERPTIRELAENIEEAMLEEQAPKPPPLVARTRPSRIPLSFAQQRLWFLDQLAPGSTAYNMAYVYRLEGELNVQALAAAFEEIARRHEVLRTTFPSLSGQPYQSIAPSSVTTRLLLVDLSELAETKRRHEMSQLVKEHAEQAYDLSKGPLYRTCLVRVGTETEDGEHILLLSFHHIISDGWTMGVFH